MANASVLTLASVPEAIDNVERRFSFRMATLAERDQVFENVGGRPVSAERAARHDVMHVQQRAAGNETAILTSVPVTLARRSRLCLPVQAVSALKPATIAMVRFWMGTSEREHALSSAERLGGPSLTRVLGANLERPVAVFADTHGCGDSRGRERNTGLRERNRPTMFARMWLRNRGPVASVALMATVLASRPPSAQREVAPATHTCIAGLFSTCSGAFHRTKQAAIRLAAVVGSALEMPTAMLADPRDHHSISHSPFYPARRCRA